MNRCEFRKHADALVTPKTRWLAIVTGCISGMTGALVFSPLFFFLPAILILGAAIQRWSPRPGRWLMWFGSLFLTLDSRGFFIVALEPSRVLGFQQVVIRLLLILCVGLIWRCDVALVIDLYKSRNAPALPDQEFPRPADWIVGVVAYFLTAWVAWSTLASLNTVPRRGNWPTLLLLAGCVGALDIAFALHAVRMRRARQT